MDNLYPDIQDLLQIEDMEPDENEETAPEQEAELIENQIEEENI